MADEGRTSRRAKKQIDYAQFVVADDEDDDFQDMTPPMKKAKTTKEKKLKLKLKKDGKDSKLAKKLARKSVDDKVYERELEMVIELSKADMHFNPGENCSKDDAGESTDEVEMPKLERVTKHSPKKSPLKKKSQRIIESDGDDLDAIEVLEENMQVTPHRGGTKKRCMAVKAARKLTDSEEDLEERRRAAMDDSTDDNFKPLELDDDNPRKPHLEVIAGAVLLDGDSLDGENEFSRRPGRGRGRGRGGRSGPKIKARLSATVQLVDKSKNKAMVHRAPPSHRPTLHTTPLPRTASGDLEIRTPTWLPPGPADGSTRSPLGGVNVKSPGIRLGLSKRSKVKPLHGSVIVP